MNSLVRACFRCLISAFSAGDAPLCTGRRYQLLQTLTGGKRATDLGPRQCASVHLEQLAVFAQMRELEEDIRRPEARRPQAQGAEAERDVLVARARPGEWNEHGKGGERELVGNDGVREQIVEVLQGVVSQHRPSLETLDGPRLARRRRATLHRYHPLEYGE